ncbi:MAG: hypothetical protein NC223_06240 [Butyrivibrio sp.]|nr:hypothetical protein [Butyrivibrio sp.]
MAHKKRRRRRRAVIPIALASLAAAAAAAFLFINYRYRITDIRITGSDRYTYEQLYEYVFENRNDENLLWFKYTNSRAPKPDIPFIAQVDYAVKMPGTVEVTVYEKSIVGYVRYKDSNMYFDKDGTVVESSAELLENAVRVEGLEFDSIVVHEKLDVPNAEIFSALNDLTQYFSKYGITVDSVSVGDKSSLSLAVGEVTVLLGQYDSDMADKVYELGCMMDKLKGLKGTLYLDKYDKNTSSVIFKEEA